MKKIYLFGLMLCAMAIGLTSCSGDDQLTDTRVTYYVNMDLQGDAFTLVPLGTPYVDACCKAELNGEDYTPKVVAVGVEDVDVNSVGFYDITYSAVNPDGYAASASRTVVVYDPTVTASLAGSYSTDMDASKYGTGKASFADRAAGYGNTTQCVGITFEEVAPGIYYVSDLLGGWYNQIRAYGTKYCMTGYVSLNPDNTLTLQSSYIAGWGDGLDYIKDTAYDPATGKISYSLSYAGQIFMDIVLNKD
jgi:hypothetical protein